MSTDKDKFVTLHEVKIDSMRPLCAGSYVYEGYSKLLNDGWPCALGKHKRRLRRRDPESPMGPHARGRASHVCDGDGEGTYMFCFAVQVGDVFIQVNEENGKKLMGMSGEDFKLQYDGSYQEIIELCDQVMMNDWTIVYVRDAHDECKAISMVKNSQTRKNHATGESSTKRDDPSDDFSRDLVFSLKSIRIKHEK